MQFKSPFGQGRVMPSVEALNRGTCRDALYFSILLSLKCLSFYLGFGNMEFLSHTNHLSKFKTKVARWNGTVAKGGGRKHVRVSLRLGQDVMHGVWAAVRLGVLWEIAECAVPAKLTPFLCHNHVVVCVWWVQPFTVISAIMFVLAFVGCVELVLSHHLWMSSNLTQAQKHG